MTANIVFQQTVNGVALAGLYVMFALGLSVTWGVLKVFNLAHAEIVAIGALITVMAGGDAGWPLIAVMPLALLGCGFLALAVDTAAFWPLRLKRLDTEELEITSLITSLGAGLIILSLAGRWTGHQEQHIPAGVFTVETWSLLGARVTNAQAVVIAAAVLLCAGTSALLGRTQFGRALRGLAYAPDMARVVGVRTEVVHRVTMFGAGAVAGIGGVAVALLLSTVNPYTGGDLLIFGVATIVLAGTGRILGLLVGGLVLGLGATLGSLWLPSVLYNALPFLVILVVLLTRPSGLFGRSEAVRV